MKDCIIELHNDRLFTDAVVRMLESLGYKTSEGHPFMDRGADTRVYLKDGLMHFSSSPNLWVGDKWKTCRENAVDLYEYLGEKKEVVTFRGVSYEIFTGDIKEIEEKLICMQHRADSK